MSLSPSACPKGSVFVLLLAAAGIASAQQGAPGKTAAEVYKNIQVLKDVPSIQFIP